MSLSISSSVSASGRDRFSSPRAAAPVTPAADKGSAVRALFDALSPRYDLFNRLASLGLDQYWRRRAIAAVGLKPGWRVLDVGAGTGDLALMAAAAVAPTGVVEALDVSAPMLRRARAKVARVPAGWHVRAVQAQAERLPAPDNTYDAVVSGFVMRNVSDLGETLAESRRVLRPGGRLAILEFSRPRAALLRWGHALWLGVGTLAIGWLVTGVRGPFTYLRRSIAGFLQPEQFLARLREAGFADVAATPLLDGAVILYQGVRPLHGLKGSDPFRGQRCQVGGSYGVH